MKKMKIANIKKAENWNNQVRKGSDQTEFWQFASIEDKKRDKHLIG